MCCYKRDRKSKTGQVKTEKHLSTAEESTTTSKEGAGVATLGLTVVVTIGSRLTGGLVTTSSGLAVVVTIGSILVGLVKSSEI